ncbi:MAG TPA: glutamate--tRNA ligase [Vicinamibacterales bacterium]|nr:glutamate--tRNA ligase [Vicinamibacterales bacterium]
MPPRLRFAPSPTGYLHVGGARTALFNWLYARRHGGTFILRIEDTDTQRSSWEMVSGILDGLSWLGIDWDEGPQTGGPHAPYFQSERLDRYRAAARDLLQQGKAFEDEGAIRFKVPPGKTTFVDSVHGPIEFDNEHIESFVILRSDSHPTYHLSVVVDDIDMQVTHVIRGDDHISNTPKQVLLYQAFGAATPAFAHVPLIMGPDKKRLSKRHGATSVMEYEKQGYLPEAMFNFLALLGWGTGSDDEMFTRQDLIERFTLEGISGGNAVFNTEKLDWFNHQHLLRLGDDELIARLHPRLSEAGYWRDALFGEDRDWFVRVLGLLKPRAKRLNEFIEQLAPFFVDPASYDEGGVGKHLGAPDAPAHVRALRDAYAAVAVWDEATLERELRTLAEARGIKAGMLIHGTRLAMTGRMVSPGLFEMLVLLGRDRVLARLDRFITALGAGVSEPAAGGDRL